MIKIIFYIAVFIRILTQMIIGDEGYFIGVYLFDICSLIYLAIGKTGVERKVLFFLAGTASYDFIKPLYRFPDMNYGDEFLAFAIGLILTLTESKIIKYVTEYYSKRFKKRG